MSILRVTDSFRQLVSSEFKIDDICIGKVTRLGKLVGEKPGPLLVTLGDSSARRNILRNVKTLRNSSSYKKVFINPDLTPKERVANKQILEELRHRRQQGEVNLIIRRNKIVSKQTSPVAMDSTNNQK